MDPTDAPAKIHGGTRTVGIIGWPVRHSLSPAIHNAAFAALGLDWVYVPLPVAPGEAGGALAALRTLRFAGANVTMPHKTDIADAVDSLTDDARRLRAVNTLVIDDDAVAGHNTDTPGFERFLRRDAGFDPAGRTALIYGAGGGGGPGAPGARPPPPRRPDHGRRARSHFDPRRAASLRGPSDRARGRRVR
jgi:shikimate dehydrogenase